MTTDQPALGDCDPNWDDLDRLCDLGAQLLHNPTKPGYWDLRHQGLTAWQIHRITTVQLTGEYL